nr:hypothetical protein CFP56_18067 [Quercus suber]
MAKENLHGESVPDMELSMDGEIEKESIKVSTPTSQMLRASKDSDVIDKEGCTRRIISFSMSPRMARDR